MGLKYRFPSPSKSKRRDSTQLLMAISCGIQRKVSDQKSQLTSGWTSQRRCSFQEGSKNKLGLKEDRKDSELGCQGGP